MGNLLFIAGNRIGDACLATGALHYASQLVPDARVTVACGPLAAPLYRAAPGLVALHEIEKVKTRGSHWFELWNKLRFKSFDLAVDLRGTLITYLLLTRHRIVHRKSHVLRHKVEELTELMDAPTTLTPRLFLDDRARADARAALPGEEPLLVLGPGANFIGKRWPGERFAALARRLAGGMGPLAGARVALVGGPEDETVVQEIVASLAADDVEAVSLVGKIDLLAVGALMERATLYVGNDSGLMHVAAAAGAPTLGLFGPSDERIYGPYGARTRALRGRDYAEIMAIGYMPHITRTLMEDITVDAVEQAASEMLHAGGLL
jgi:heptosyltransferase-3